MDNDGAPEIDIDSGAEDNSAFDIEDFTSMKLIEEVIEMDQEIKMKQKWINSRMKMLHELQKKHKKGNMKSIINQFL